MVNSQWSVHGGKNKWRCWWKILFHQIAIADAWPIRSLQFTSLVSHNPSPCGMHSQYRPGKVGLQLLAAVAWYLKIQQTFIMWWTLFWYGGQAWSCCNCMELPFIYMVYNMWNPTVNFTVFSRDEILTSLKLDWFSSHHAGSKPWSSCGSLLTEIIKDFIEGLMWGLMLAIHNSMHSFSTL